LQKKGSLSRSEKLKSRFLSKPNDFTWSELVKLLNLFGYVELTKGKTGGSRRKFANEQNEVISLHKPHPTEILKRYAIEQIISHLKEKGKL